MVPPVVQTDNTPYVTMIVFRNKFGRVIADQMFVVGEERYKSVGMRLGKLIVKALLRRGDIEPHIVEFVLYLFLQIAEESLGVLEKAKIETAMNEDKDKEA